MGAVREGWAGVHCKASKRAATAAGLRHTQHWHGTGMHAVVQALRQETATACSLAHQKLAAQQESKCSSSSQNAELKTCLACPTAFWQALSFCDQRVSSTLHVQVGQGCTCMRCAGSNDSPK